MIKFPISHFEKQRDGCLAAAASSRLPNDRNRHLESAAAWQRIIDKLTVSEDA